MKKSYVYFLAPLVGLIIFSVLYWNFSSTYDAKLQAVADAARKQKIERQEAEAQQRLKAVEQAKAEQDRRKAERAAKEAQAAKDRDDREALIQAKNKALIEEDKLDTQVKRLSRDVDATKKEIARFEEEKKNASDEQAFLREYVKRAEANAKSLTEVMDKIAAADDAAAKAAAAAAAPKK